MYKFSDYLVTLKDGRKVIEFAMGNYDAKARCLRRGDIREEDIISVELYKKETREAPPAPAERAREYIRNAQRKLTEE